jgi:hypothetical protein
MARTYWINGSAIVAFHVLQKSDMGDVRDHFETARFLRDVSERNPHGDDL